MALSLSELDLALIWHPYTQHLNRPAPLPITRGRGALLFDDKGRSYIDAISSWWVNIHGHAHPYIAEKIYQQALQLEQVIFTAFTHEPAVLLAQRLLPLLPGNFSKIFYSDNGSTAVEVAIKMAIQFQAGRLVATGKKKRNKILVLKNAYHGDTFGAMSVSERGVFTQAFQDYLFEVVSIDLPDEQNIWQILEDVDRLGEELCCFIYEPLLQGAGGMKIYEAGPLDQLLRRLRALGVICIADEILTGFGRTGKMFSGEYLETKPDLICLSKGLTGGTMALGVTAVTGDIFEGFLSQDRARTFFHGHSFTANPLACTAALASLDLFEQEGVMEKIQILTRRQQEFCQQLANTGSPAVRSPRSLGTVLAFELESEREGYLSRVGPAVGELALENGILLRPLGNTVYIMPPYCISAGELDQVYRFLLDMPAHQW